LAIYHLTATVISRARGQRIVASAAARSATTLYDEYYGITHNHSRKRGVTHVEIMAPAGSPAWVQDRALLWNRVEAAERRVDSQLARELEVGLPVELSQDQSVALLRDFITRQFLAEEMIADFSVRRDNPNNPHAHILLTLRKATLSGFGPKVREWNRKTNLMDWRSAWAERANQHLARAGHDARIDHRTLEAQQIELAPGPKIGIGGRRPTGQGLPKYLEERIAEQKRTAKQNGDTILLDPTAALRALTRQQATFTHRDVANFLRSRTDPAQYEAVLLAVMSSNELVALRPDGESEARFTSRDLLEAEKSLVRRAAVMAPRRGHGVAPQWQVSATSQHLLSEGHRGAFEYLVGDGDLKALAVQAGNDKSALLAVAREAWQAQGFKVQGAALSGLALKNLVTESGIESRTLESYEHDWLQEQNLLTQNDVIVVDESEMIGLKQLERVLAAADKARAKLVLIGDSTQLQAMGTMSPLRDLIAKAGP